MTSWTIQKLLNWITEYYTTNRVDQPRLSAELLLSHVLGMKRIELYTQFDKVVEKLKLDELHDLVKRGSKGEPIAYLVGKTEFYSLSITVNRSCLIPRPETELLVERAIEFLRGRSGEQLVCDLCTGSGCVAAAIGKNFAGAEIIATDICDEALKVAEENIERHGLKERVKLLCGDLFDPVLPHLDDGKFDLIVSNPPYVSTAEFSVLEKNVKDYEPSKALLAGDDGLDICRRIIEKANDFLKADGAVIMEIGYRQGDMVRELLERANCFNRIKIEKDFNNNDRIAMAEIKK